MLHSQSSGTTTSSDGSQNTSPVGGNGGSQHHSSHLAAIAGSAIGSAVLVIITATILVLFRRRKREEYARAILEHTAVAYEGDDGHRTGSRVVQAQITRVVALDATISTKSAMPGRQSPSSSESGSERAQLSSSLQQSRGDRPTVVTPENNLDTSSRALVAQITPAASRFGRPPMQEIPASVPVEQAGLPALIERLNAIMSNLPPGGEVETAPPQYE